MIKNVLFDLDGTIINSEPGIIHCLKHTAKYFGVAVPPLFELRKCIGPPLSGSFLNVFHLSEDQVEEAFRVYRAEYARGGMFDCLLYDGILDCIRTLHEEGFHMALTSSKHEEACVKILRHFSLDHYFDDIVGSDDNVRETKAEVIEEFFRIHPDLSREDTVLIGDTKFDMEGAALTGIRGIGVTYGFGSLSDLEEYSASYIAHNPGEITKIILEECHE